MTYPPKMRNVSFVKHLEFEYQGNIFCKAVALGDIDNDGTNEFAIGNIHGEVLVHKGSNTKPWRKCTELGMITCLDIGDVCNDGKNYLITLSSEGWCHLFHAEQEQVKQDEMNGSEKNKEKVKLLKHVHRQHLPANSKVLLISDIDEDGYNELVIGYSDRRVKSFRWTPVPVQGESNVTNLNTLSGKFTAVETWTLAGQIGTMTVNKRKDGATDMMVSQPGGTFVTLLDTHAVLAAKQREAKEEKQKQASPEKTNSAQSQQNQAQPAQPKSPKEKTESNVSDISFTKGKAAGPSVVYHPLGSARARNPGVTTEIIGNISRRKKGSETYVPNYYTICTLDGTLTLVDEDKILWSLYVDHQLFALTKLDVTGDGTEEVVACSWDGQTYIVNLNRDVVRFQFPENVAAFCAGYYSVNGTEDVPCFIYVTFNNRVMVYHSIQMSEVGCTNLLQVMEKQEGYEELLTCLNADASNTSQVRQLYHWCLYGTHTKLNNGTS